MIHSVIHWLRRYALPLSFLCFVGLLLWATWFIPRSPVWRSAVSSFLDDSRLFAIALIVSGVIPLLWVLLWKLPQWQVAYGRSYGFGDRAKTNKVAKRPLTQASLRCKRWLKPSSLHRIPTPLKRCWMSHLQALSTIPEPSGKSRSLYLA